MEVMATTEAIRRAKLHSNRNHQQTNTQLFTRRMCFVSPTNSVQALEENIFTITVETFSAAG